jgi:peptidoglycan/xylan/chitin deacetylase (PgdA/CDA1 family)
MEAHSRDYLTTRRARVQRRRRRRRLATAAGAGAVLLAFLGVALASTGDDAPAPVSSKPQRPHRPIRPAAVRPVRLPPIPALHPGIAHLVVSGPHRRQVALTFDDGFCPPCVANLVRAVERTGAHVTLFPNGVYSRSWEPQAARIRNLIAHRQVAIGNHTFSHGNAATQSPSAFEEDLGRNERWIERTFGVTARPFFRPPYGSLGPSTIDIAGRLGYTKVVNWSGTLADSEVRSIPYLMTAIKHWAGPGAIILAHGNYPATPRALPRMLAVLKARHLQPVTLAELLGR